MYALLIAVTSHSTALGATILNRLTITVVELALFLAGISSHFRLAGVRYGLISVCGVILIFVVSQLLILPKPPL